jgi:hypothetical protein
MVIGQKYLTDLSTELEQIYCTDLVDSSLRNVPLLIRVAKAIVVLIARIIATYFDITFDEGAATFFGSILLAIVIFFSLSRKMIVGSFGGYTMFSRLSGFRFDKNSHLVIQLLLQSFIGHASRLHCTLRDAREAY